jgi:hypothetical protein
VSLYFQALDISQGFDTWTGFLTRGGIFQASGIFNPRFYTKSAVVRRSEPMFITDWVRDAESGLWEEWNEGALTLVMSRATRLQARYHWSSEVFRYLFLRGIAEYNSFRKQLVTDLLASFTYIPGTVFHVGYGSLYEKVEWRDDGFVPGRDLLETRRGVFVKASYLWRM